MVAKSDVFTGEGFLMSIGDRWWIFAKFMENGEHREI